MTFFESISAVSTLLQSASSLATRLQGLLSTQNRILAKLLPTTSYENLLLDVVFYIKDVQGRHATVFRKQQVRFLVNDASVVRDVAWGEGSPMADYSVEGARYLGIQPEGGKQVVLLGLPQSPLKGDRATIRTTRTIRNAVTRSDGYAEVLVERPTERLVVTVKFPRKRPPRQARLVTSPPGPASRTLRCLYSADGRAYLRWSTRQPKRHVTYSLRWLW